MSTYTGDTSTATDAAASSDIDSSSADDAIAQMEASFDYAIAQSAKITAITTAKKAELDATKQRPQN